MSQSKSLFVLMSYMAFKSPDKVVVNEFEQGYSG